ncbi:MAG: 4-hydroxy-tetrahydrodipicolinate reductase [Fervidobacterium sp.]
MKFGVVGGMGKMGREIIDYFVSLGDELVLKVDIDTFEEKGIPEIIIDFSSRSGLDTTIELCKRYKCGLVIGTTSLTEEDFLKLHELSQTVPVVQSYNFSEGINILKKILHDYSSYFQNWDASIVEIHHNKKKDAPSGTAILLENAIGRVIPISSLRVGGIFGEHTIIFANDGEVVEISHKALSRRAFSIGARKAALFALTKQNGFYTFSDLLQVL